ncbi:MAG: transposase [Candidatus Cloacimonetes bacterium]|nr:transposase [Candidatus Cloacimonadota bacterium]
MDLVKKQGEYLPHWTLEHSIYHICFRLQDSLPQEIIRKWKFERIDIIESAKQKGRPLSLEESDRLRFLYSEKIDKYLDIGTGTCYIKNASVAQMISSALMYFNEQRYKLYAWCIMPNHVHAIVRAFNDDLDKIIHSWKSYTANQANKILGRTGNFWHKDYYNHIIRNDKEFDYQINYVWLNAEKAGLRDWKFRYKI